MISTDSITDDMRAFVAREIPAPAPGERQSAFELRRELRLFNLSFEIQKFLDLYCEDDAERLDTLAEYRRQLQQTAR